MEAKLQELTGRIYREGVERARTDADALLHSAESDAAAILQKARDEAQAIREQSLKEAEDLKARVLADVKVAGTQLVSSFRQEVIEAMTHAAFGKDTNAALAKTDFVANLIHETVLGYTKGGFGGAADLSILLPEAQRKDLEAAFGSKLKTLLDQGLAISFSNRIENGFRIAAANGSWTVSFTEADFAALFAGFLKRKARDILFPGA